MTHDYGFNTDEVQYDKQGLPVGTYKVLIREEELKETDRAENPTMLIVDYEILDGEYKGKSGRVWYNIFHTNAQTSNIAKQAIKRIADATGRAVSASSPLKGRVLTIEVAEQKKDNRYTEIKKYLPEDHINNNAPF